MLSVSVTIIVNDPSYVPPLLLYEWQAVRNCVAPSLSSISNYQSSSFIQFYVAIVDLFSRRVNSSFVPVFYDSLLILVIMKQAFVQNY